MDTEMDTAHQMTVLCLIQNPHQMGIAHQPDSENLTAVKDVIHESAE